MDENGIDLSDLFGKLAPMIETVKSNPALLSGAASLFSSLGGRPAGGEKPPPPPGRESDRRRLLRALSPYLSPERQRVLSTLLALLEAWETIEPLIGGLRLSSGAGKE